MKTRRPTPPRRRMALPAEVPVVAAEAPPPAPPAVETAPPEPTDMTEEEIVKMLKAAYT